MGIFVKSFQKFSWAYYGIVMRVFCDVGITGCDIGALSKGVVPRIMVSWGCRARYHFQGSGFRFRVQS